ncbi:MAG: DNA topoisomerase 3 [Puniceicoccales bacterium]|jgi:DNA topoisomerase-3|nr:DNA topoisomerase 3 [Puniceicoccales bacterium]
MKQLVIAEKPSVARDLASALGSFEQNKRGYFERTDMIITSAVGHIVELYMPEDFDVKYKRWSLKNLPILPEKFLLKPIERTLARFEALKKLMQRKEVGGLVNACDAGREGELIFTYVCELADCQKPKQRLWLSSMTPEAIREAFEHLRDAESMQPLQDAARCRAEADWLVGINGTRVVTGRMLGARRREVASVGRVQTPTLALMCEREESIRNFIAVPFWRIQGNFSITQGTYTGWLQKVPFNKNLSNPNDRSDRFWEKEAVNRTLETLQSFLGNSAEVSEMTKKTKQSSPRLFDLTSLQRECNQRYGYPAKFTLDTAQALYEKHKVLTYPRTDSRALPEDYVPVCALILKHLEENYRLLSQKILSNQWLNAHQKTIFNNKAVSDHFAIIPTEKAPGDLKDSERKVYDLVVQRFLSVFFPPAEFSVTTRLTSLAGFVFKTEGKVLVYPGWLEVVKKTDLKETLPALVPEDNNRASVVNFESLEDTTRPPARFTEASLLASMEHAGQLVDDDELAEAMKEKGLGTPATRAQIIENLIGTRYVERQDKELVPTSKAEQLLEFLQVVQSQELASPALTGEWECRLRQIQNRQLSRTRFMSDIRLMTSKIVENILAFKESDQEGRQTKIISPSDGLPMLETFRSFRSQDGKIAIFKMIGNRRMSEKEIIELLKDKKIGPLEGFRSKAGKAFSAILELTDDYQVKFNFHKGESNYLTLEDLSEYPSVGVCPLCKSIVRATDVNFVCEHVQGDVCTFKMARTLLHRTIQNEQFEKLLTTGKTDLIDRFRSKKTGKYFSAYLVLKENGTIGFEFVKKPVATTGNS